MVYRPLNFTDAEIRYFSFITGACSFVNGLKIGNDSPLTALILTAIASPFFYRTFRTIPMPEEIKFRYPECLENKLD